MKKVLFLSYHFYPRNDSALQRVAGFYKYLPENGWEPWVLCPRWSSVNCDYYDAEMEPLFEQARIAGAFPYTRSKYCGTVGRFKYAVTMLKDPRALVNRIAKPVLGSCLFRAPEEVFFSSVRRLPGLLETQNFDAIWATCPPTAPLAVANWAHRKFGIPWIADFRDNLDQDSLHIPARDRQRAMAYSKLLMRSASRIVGVSGPLAESLSSSFGDKVDVITNGFDPADFSRNEPVSNNNKLTIVYLGRLIAGHRDPSPLLQAIDRLATSGEITTQDLAVHFYGPTASELASFVADSPCSQKYITCFPWVGHSESIQIQQSASALLLLSHAGEAGILTGKLFEYLASGRPVLCIPGDSNGIEEILRRANTGFICRDAGDVVNQIRFWLSKIRIDGQLLVEPNWQEIHLFSRRKHAEHLGRILDNVLQH